MWETYINGGLREDLHCIYNTVEIRDYKHLKFIENELKHYLLTNDLCTFYCSVKLVKNNNNENTKK